MRRYCKIAFEERLKSTTLCWGIDLASYAALGKPSAAQTARNCESDINIMERRVD
jgi:hypothetical protein